jgi:hypothetical protein
MSCVGRADLPGSRRTVVTSKLYILPPRPSYLELAAVKLPPLPKENTDVPQGTSEAARCDTTLPPSRKAG